LQGNQILWAIVDIQDASATAVGSTGLTQRGI